MAADTSCFLLWSWRRTFTCLQSNVLCVHLRFLSVSSAGLRAAHTLYEATRYREIRVTLMPANAALIVYKNIAVWQIMLWSYIWLKVTLYEYIYYFEFWVLVVFRHGFKFVFWQRNTMQCYSFSQPLRHIAHSYTARFFLHYDPIRKRNPLLGLKRT